MRAAQIGKKTLASVVARDAQPRRPKLIIPRNSDQREAVHRDFGARPLDESFSFMLIVK
jgi:hypothetical protein